MDFVKSDYERYVPVFGDIHGNLEGLVNTVKYLQKETDRKFDFVFQLGDFGYFPSDFTGEKVKGKSELGVHNYFNEESIRNSYRDDDKIGFKLIFIRGNHEDQAKLSEYCKKVPEGLIRLDSDDFLTFLPDGRGISIPYNYGNVVFSGFGGIDPLSRSKKYEKNPGIGFSKEGLNQILDLANAGIDILLTHQGPVESKKGSTEIDALYQLVNPQLALHGHSHLFNEYKKSDTNIYSLSKMPSTKNPFLDSNDFYGFIDLEEIKFHNQI